MLISSLKEGNRLCFCVSCLKGGKCEIKSDSIGKVIALKNQSAHTLRDQITITLVNQIVDCFHSLSIYRLPFCKSFTFNNSTHPRVTQPFQ